MGLSMASESKSGVMELSMKACGPRARLMAKENSLISTEIPTMVNGKTTMLTVMGFTFMLRRGPSTKDTGKMTCNTDQGWKFILMEIDMRACSRRVKEMVKVLSS